jgi:hypothetical protein
LWKADTIDWDGNPLHPDDGSEEDPGNELDVADRLLVYLRANELSSIVSLVNLFSNRNVTIETTSDAINAHLPENLFTNGLYLSLADWSTSFNSASSRKCFRVHSLRLTELSERTSSVMWILEPH